MPFLNMSVARRGEEAREGSVTSGFHLARDGRDDGGRERQIWCSAAEPSVVEQAPSTPLRCPNSRAAATHCVTLEGSRNPVTLRRSERLSR